MAQEVSEFLSQNPRVPAWVEELRCEGETDKHWRHRREFLLRNAGDLAPTGGAASATTNEAAEAERRSRNRQVPHVSSLAAAAHLLLHGLGKPRLPGVPVSRKVSLTGPPHVWPENSARLAAVGKGSYEARESAAPLPSKEGVEESSKKRAIEGKNNSVVEQDHVKISAQTERASAHQENSSASESSGNSTRSSGISSQSSSANDGDRSVSSQSGSSISSQVTTAGSGKASQSEAPDKPGSAAFMAINVFPKP
ncbi:CDKN2A-interacting protein [Tupaia chinensis]|uniref:CDKN2A-interacting protein n=1 Tax=Tupaia chinensis TaxID=246437 RepID=L9JDL0_TUPCH|nr:CDKN2A-interacting protein [Tupaia chinensis]